jgi:hypothetical protein
MLEEFKGLESVSEIPLFSGDHWAASIHNKLKEVSDAALPVFDPILRARTNVQQLVSAD